MSSVLVSPGNSTILKVMNKYLVVVVIILLVLSNLYFWQKTERQNYEVNTNEETSESRMKTKCFSWTSYDQAARLWRWRPEKLNEYFPTKEEAVANCTAMFDSQY